MRIRSKTYQFDYCYWDNVKKNNEEEYEYLGSSFSIDVEELLECENSGEILELIIEEINNDLESRVEHRNNYDFEFEFSDRVKIETYYWYLKEKLDLEI